MSTQQTFEFLAPPIAPTKPQRTRLTDLPGKPRFRAPSQAESQTPSQAQSQTQPQTQSPALSSVFSAPAPSPDALMRSHGASTRPSGALTRASGNQVATPVDRSAVLADLRKRAGCLSSAATQVHRADIYSTGCSGIDAMLPQGGLRIGTVTEWVSEHDSSGASAISLATIAARMKDTNVQGPLVVISEANYFYPPAAEAIGIDLKRVIWAKAQTHADTVWAIDQALRCPAVAVVWARVGGGLDDRDARRFQLAAEEGQTSAVLVRPRTVRGRPTFADVRLHVAPEMHVSQQNKTNGVLTTNQSPFVSRVTLDRCRGSASGCFVDVMIDDHGQLQAVKVPKSTIYHAPISTSSVHLASELAHPKTSSGTGSKSRRA
ncbi:hypothetical protein Pla22_39680 [Rubripirellula amarantea]|uniref:Recombinase A n=1 Tax=Rubripirellula amarantea TaxID=2527999 RepID=A0A5C5WM73_9BACT|nr:hypothetical protein [Rubripirellula amarantea]TWT51191.1 hypothetical protein Pla22_39680 [Rubripirellula amarantea]